MKDRKAIESALAYVPQWLEYQQAYMPYVGAQVALRLDGELIFNQAFGYADLENEVTLTTDHLFRIASHSKTFTGTAIFQLEEQGKLRLDDTVRQHLPELKKSDFADVTIRELLAHGSGMTRDGRDSTFWSLDREFPDRAELLETITVGKVLEPNEHFKYSNIGYSLLGLIIEAVSGEDYRSFVLKNIVKKLKLKDTGPDLDLKREVDLAKGYSSRAHGPQRIEIEHIDTFAESSATGFFSRAEELTAYFSAHLDGDETLICDASKRRMRQPQWTITDTESYGLGLSITKVNGRTYYGHSGGYPGHITMSRFDPERRLAISVLTNSNDGPAGVLCSGILELIDLALNARGKAITVPVKPKQARAFTGRFASLWGVGDVAHIGGRLYSLMPSMPNPASEAVELEIVSDTETKVVGDKGFGAYAEMNTYAFDKKGKVKEIMGAGGARLLPMAGFKLPERVVRPQPRTAVKT